MNTGAIAHQKYGRYLLTNLLPYALAALFVLLGAIGPQPFLFFGAFLLAAALLFVPRGLAFAVVLYQFLLYLPVSADIHALANYTYSIGPVRVYGFDLITAAVALLVLRSLARPRYRLSGNWAQPLYITTLALVFLIAAQAVLAYFRGIPLDAIIRDGALYLSALLGVYLAGYFLHQDWQYLLRFSYQLLLLLPIFQIYQLAQGYTWLTSSGTERTMFIGIDVLYLVAIGYHLLRKQLTNRDLLALAYFSAAIAVTQYRSAILALLVMLAVTLYFYLSRNAFARISKLAMAALAGVFAIIVLSVLMQLSYLDDLGTRFSTLLDTQERNAQARFGMWELSWQAFLAHPVMGVGLGQAISDAIPGLSFIADRRWTPHSMVAQMLAVHGIVGSLIVLGLHMFLLLRLLYLRAADAGQRHVWETCLVIFSGLLVVNLLNSTFTMPRAAFVFWGFVAFVLLGRLPRQELSTSSARFPVSIAELSPLRSAVFPASRRTR